jgi:ABC-2 type transport system ATP-binding protein
MAEPVIVVRHLRKSYGSYEAVRGIDMEVRRGEIFAFLGPNGAGKTTTVEILEGYRDRTSGDVEVLGVDPARGTADWRARLGVVLQDCRMSSLLTVRETLQQYAGYYPSPRPVGNTIELVGLGDKADVRAGRLSGGQRRRLDVGVALIGDPDLLFLDEPTTGFDPAARREAWEVIGGLRDLGKTVLLTTHYMDEAQNLADRVAIIKGGEIVAEGGPNDLGGAERSVTMVRFRLPAGLALGALPGALAGRVGARNGFYEFSSEEPVADLAALCGWAVSEGVDVAELEVHRPSLEDVYLELTSEASP